jgi:hypothetical protein
MRSTPSRRRRFGQLASAALLLGLSADASARPEAPPIVCDTYPDAAVCAGQLANCQLCHVSTWPASWNSYGAKLVGALQGGDFEADLADAMLALDAEDSDEDGITNIDELDLGTNPGDAEDVWPMCALGSDHPEGLPVSEEYDFERALRRVSLLYCGTSPSYDEVASFADLPDDAARYQALHETLDACLASDWWRDEGLPRLADWRIRPVAAVGKDSPVGIVIGDYEWDYRLWTWAMSGDRDVRDLLLADYHVDADAQGNLSPVDGAIGGFPGQPLAPEQRAGMITTQWFFAINTMFSPLPRTTAAQAYRAYLGNDMAKQEGIFPVAGEPLDVDDKGVTEGECVNCHSTLDPLSYAFASYNGISGPLTGTYAPSRPSNLIEGWNDPETVVFGETVDGVPGWAEVAANSDAFKRTVVLTLFHHAMNREPLPDEESTFAAIWRALPDTGWSANAMIHLIVDTHSFGAR